MSRGVRDHVRKLGRFAFEDLGEQKVRNIAQPIRAFRVRVGNESYAAELANDRAIAAEVAVTSVAPEPAGISHDVSPEFELAYWETVKDTSDPAELAAYLEKYPQGVFVALAETRRQSLVTHKTDAPASAGPDVVAVELAFWETVKDSDNPAMYEAYLEQYPNGPFAALAKVKLGELGSSTR